MGGKLLAGPSSDNTTATDSAVQINLPLYNTNTGIINTNSNLLSGWSTSERNNMLASTLAAITASTSADMSSASALVSVFGAGVLESIGLYPGSLYDQSSKVQTVSRTPHTSNALTDNKFAQKNVRERRQERKDKGGKIEDIIKRIRDKKGQQ